jgi:hypothetical protein
MDTFEYLNDYSSDSDDEVSELTPEEYEELLFYSKINKMQKFKEYINKEPEFYGIYNIKTPVLLSLFENYGIKQTKYKITNYQFEIIENLYQAIYGRYPEESTVLKICYKIFEKIYV